jgi:hypothetical protein
VAVLSATGAGRRGLPQFQRRSRAAADLPSGHAAHRGHIFIAFLAYCLHVTLGRRLRDLAPGLTPRSVLEKLGAMQMLDGHLPTSDGRELILTRYTQPEPDQRLLLERLKLALPEQPSPKITAAQAQRK